MILNGFNCVTAVILRYFTEFGSFGVNHVNVVEIKPILSGTKIEISYHITKILDGANQPELISASHNYTMVEWVVPHQPFFFSGNWAKWSFVWYKNLDRSFFRFVTMHAFDRRTERETDRRTDRILIARPRLRSVQRRKKRSYFVQQTKRSPTPTKTVISGSPIPSLIPAILHQRQYRKFYDVRLTSSVADCIDADCIKFVQLICDIGELFVVGCVPRRQNCRCARRIFCRQSRK